MRSRTFNYWNVAIAVLLTACVGIVDQPTGDRTNPEGGNGALNKRWLDDTAGPNPLRRLTMDQLDHTIVDITGVELEDSLFPIEAQRDGFTTFAALQVSSETQVRAFDRIAETVAARVNLADLVSCTTYDAACAAALLDGFGRLAFRGALTTEEFQRYQNVYDVALPLGEEAAMRYVVRGLLSAPRFLYRSYAFGDQPGTTGYGMAEKLSYFLWASAPDDELLNAAEAGELDTPTGRRDRARLMLQDPRAREEPLDSLRCGRSHCCGIARTGELHCWGRNDGGQVGSGTVSEGESIPINIQPGTVFTSYDGGELHSCAIRGDGALLCWGSNDRGQLGLGDRERRLTPTRVCFD